MDSFRIQGGRRLAGRIKIEGSKNATLPLLAAALCTDGTLTLRNVPCLSDISNMLKLLRELGVDVDGECGTIKTRVVDQNRIHAHYDIVKTMRASISVLGPMLARRRRARVSMPGGCAFGERPIDLHLRGLERRHRGDGPPGTEGNHHLPRRAIRLDRARHRERDVGGRACEGHHRHRERGLRA
jgi:UDP-N-acetylglucosamine 1-carboxyvinyltransferase